MQARDEAELARGVRLFLRPGALLALGLACYAIGLVASAQAPLISHDLYIATSGAVCDGDSGLATCWTVDPAEFHPALPDLSSYRSGGFGLILPGAVPGGRLYESACRVAAIDLRGRVYVRADYPWLLGAVALRWALGPGLLLLGIAGVIAAMRVSSSRRAAGAVYGALAVDAGAASVPLVLHTALTRSIPSDVAAYLILAAVGILALIAVVGLIVAVVLTIGLRGRPEIKLEAGIARVQVGAAAAVACGFVGAIAWFASTFKLCF
ncbi:MAG TPA: hypothetical protein VKF28_07470 [Candidatus Dormibacteraeota bacterium]|nr:hypothetical protein [Candidatus Dormibacteraeota bacterium]